MTKPTKTDKIKIFSGRLILPFGTPIIITTAWEDATRYHSQSIAILDRLDHTLAMVVHEQNFAKSAPTNIRPGCLTPDEAIEWCLKYGYDMAAQEIPRLLWDYGYERLSKGATNFPNVAAIPIDLHQQQDMELVYLSYILKRHEKFFDWLEGKAKSEILKALMKTVRGYDAGTRSSFPEQE